MNQRSRLGSGDMRYKRARSILNGLGPAGRRCEILVVANSEPDILAFGSRKRPYVACTTGLLYLLNPDETEGVFAHEVVHVLRGHTTTRWLTRLLERAGVSKWLPFAMAEAFHSRRIELVTDADIIRLGADPRALHSALRKLGNSTSGMSLWEYLTTGTHPRHGKRLRLLEQIAMRTVKAGSVQVTYRRGSGPPRPRRLSPATGGRVLGR